MCSSFLPSVSFSWIHGGRRDAAAPDERFPHWIWNLRCDGKEGGLGRYLMEKNATRAILWLRVAQGFCYCASPRGSIGRDSESPSKRD